MRHITRLESVLLLGMLCLAACTDQVWLSNEAIGRVVRDVGFSCEGTNAAVVATSNSTWRVACANAETYMAVVQDNGDLCIEPLFLGDGGPAPQILNAPPPRCATPR